MRLWHQYLIKYLPKNQLLGQHREICALRGLCFGRKHKTVDYVFNHPYGDLYNFHLIVMNEMKKRKYMVDNIWYDNKYRGKSIGYDYSSFTKLCKVKKIIYKEHNSNYLIECLINLYNKGIILSIKRNSKIYHILKYHNLLYLVTVLLY